MQASEQAGKEPLSPPSTGIVNSFRQYLLAVGPAILQLQGEEHVLAQALEDPEYTVHVDKFLADLSVSTLYVEAAKDSTQNAPSKKTFTATCSGTQRALLVVCFWRIVTAQNSNVLRMW